MLHLVMDMRCQSLEWTDVSLGPKKSLHLGACTECGSVTWRDARDELDPAAAMEALFGSFELVSQLPALRAPGAVVLAYRPPSRRAAQVLTALEPGTWIEGQPGLWMSTDGTVLLLSPSDPLFIANLTQRA